MVDTANVTDRRKLRFGSPDELMADVERLVAADRAGTLRQTGNWTLGQTLGHLGSWVSFAYDGYPPELRPPWFIRTFVPLLKGKFTKGVLPAGFRIPKVSGGTVATERLSTDEGIARFHHGWDRLRKAPPGIPNPVFGRLTHLQWIDLHLRHAELHLGFLHP
jgi:hypothetical protein